MQCLGVSSPQKHMWSLEIDIGTQEAVKSKQSIQKDSGTKIFNKHIQIYVIISHGKNPTV